DKLVKGGSFGGKSFKVHIDGYNLLPYLSGQEQQSPRRGFLYFNDDGDIVALRVENWKIVFEEQRAPGTLAIWAEPFVALRVPKLFALHADPFERADVTSNIYYDWFLDHDFIIFAAQQITAQFIATFKDFPPSQRPASFTIDQAMEKLKQNVGD